MSTIDSNTLRKITRRGVAEIIPENDFIKRLNEGTPLRLKMGFDPSKPDLHLGHVVGLKKLRQLQDLGHELTLIVGDWTAQIGDPSGQSDTRSMLTASEVQQNAETYMQQFFKIVDPEKTKAVYQSEWFGNFSLTDVIRLTSFFTVNQFLHRDDFSKRYATQKPIAVTELLYPLLQAYDSVAIKADVEFGGTDQLFNLMVGRELQEKMGQDPQIVFLMPILPGTDGVRRMGKSLNNYIAIEDSPKDMFGKIMSLPDEVIPLYFELLTDLPEPELEHLTTSIEQHTENPMDFKKKLGVEMVSWFHSPEAAITANAEFERVIQRGQEPEEIPEVSIAEIANSIRDQNADGVLVDVLDLLVITFLAKSKSEARRLMSQNAIEIDGERASEETSFVRFGSIIRAGRRRFVRVVNT
ncbi:MAG TPA: tyrosine--tRNA ligase [Dehalococcoidia bacterium]|nr:tyrosine--tRNA ligase [Dehalococcoidia bacterium]|tara:strand:+ start:6704 stop:7936 length:1233 start_codon:yes stop_codon:yes gene_type:complete